MGARRSGEDRQSGDASRANKNSSKTRIGGENQVFHTTVWSDVMGVQTLDPERRRIAQGVILGQYWKPVYAYLRRKGCDNEKAKDLTQGFFQEVVLGRGLIARADRKKGKFRTLLLTALNRYTVSVHRAETARKRAPANRPIPLDGIDLPGVPEPEDTMTPDQAFAHSWASELIDRVLTVVKAGCLEAGQEQHWQVFLRTVVEPSLTGAEAPSQAQLCRELGIDGESRISNMKVTVKRRFKTILRAWVRRFVSSDEDTEGEIRELMDILSKGGARN